METVTVADKILMYAGDEGYTHSNTYYITDEKKVLIDAGYDFNGEIDMLILTHCHPDHMIHAYDIKKRTGCKLLICEKDKDFFKRFINSNEAVEVEMLKENDEIKTGQYCFKVIETPGHSPGSIILWDEDKRILFSGDVKSAGAGYGNYMLPGGDKNLLKQSLEKIKSLRPFLLLPGHFQTDYFDTDYWPVVKGYEL